MTTNTIVLIAALAWNLVLGGVLGSLGVAYVALVVRRGREWSALRRAAGGVDRAGAALNAVKGDL